MKRCRRIMDLYSDSDSEDLNLRPVQKTITSPTSGKTICILDNVQLRNSEKPMSSAISREVDDDDEFEIFTLPKLKKQRHFAEKKVTNSPGGTSLFSDVSVSQLPSDPSDDLRDFDEDIFSINTTPSSSRSNRLNVKRHDKTNKNMSSTTGPSEPSVCNLNVNNDPSSTFDLRAFGNENNMNSTPSSSKSNRRSNSRPHVTANIKSTKKISSTSKSPSTSLSVQPSTSASVPYINTYDDNSSDSESSVSLSLENYSSEEIDNDSDVEINSQDTVDDWIDITERNIDFEEYSDLSKVLITPDNNTPSDFYKLFLTDEIMDKMVEETNDYASDYISRVYDIKAQSRARQWKNTNKEEMYRFFGVMLAMGLVKVPKITDYWSKNTLYRNEFIASIMSRDRFLLLLRFWHFSANTNENNDKLYKIRAIYNMLLERFKSVLEPGKVVVIDESMVPWRGRLGIRQYLKNKSHPYGVKLYKLCSPGGYTHNIIVYTGKGEDGRENNHGRNVCVKLMNGLENQGRTLIVDNFYTSVGLAEEMLEKKTLLCGTLRSNKRGLPKAVVKTKLKRGQIIGKMNGKGVKVIKWVDKRPVLMITTCKEHDASLKNTGKINRKTNVEIMKPECVLSYNANKKGIDYSDQMSSYYSALKRGLKWYRKVMMELLFGTTVTNAWLVYNMKNEVKINKKQFLESLITKFTNKQMNGLEITSTETTNNENVDEEHKLIRDQAKRNCSGCYQILRQTLSSKQADKKVKKVKTKCIKCNKTYCQSCFNKVHSSSKNN